MSKDPPNAQHASETRVLLAQRAFLAFLPARALAGTAVQIQSLTIGWQVYQIARETQSVKEAALTLSMIGLVQFLPVMLLTLFAGTVVDRYSRRNIMVAALVFDVFLAGALAVMAVRGTSLLPIFLIAGLFGASRAFLMPAGGAMTPMLVPRELMPRALAWNSLVWQLATVIGPTIGGLIIGAGGADGVTSAYRTAAFLYLAAAGMLLLIRRNTTPERHAGSRWEMVKEGLAYVWRQKIVFGAISLDLFAVLLGGATLLLPAFAADVLNVGPEGFGVLRAAPGIGAAMVAIYLATRPVRRHAGLVMFAGVGVFGFATLIFGVAMPLTQALGAPHLAMPLTVAALAVLGGADMLSVYIRQTLIQIVTPDAMRGRVAATSSLFIGASNELGEFESGIVARFFGPIGAAVFGGVGAMTVTAVWAKLFPELRKADRLV